MTAEVPEREFELEWPDPPEDMNTEVPEREFELEWPDPPEDMNTEVPEDVDADEEDSFSDESGPNRVFPDGSHHLGERLEFTSEHLPNEYNRPDIELHNRDRRHLVYRDVDDFFDNILDLEDDVRDPKFIDWMISRGFAIRRVPNVSGTVIDYLVRVKPRKITMCYVKI